MLAQFFENDHAADATLKWFAEAGVGVEHRVTPDLNFQPNLQLVPPTSMLYFIEFTVMLFWWCAEHIDGVLK